MICFSGMFLNSITSVFSEIELINSRKKPTRLPSDPFLTFGVKTRLIYERFKAKSEI